MAEQPLFCPFCSLDAERIVVQNELALALDDAFPVTPGHILVVSRRHVADYFELSPEEQAAVWELVNRVRERPAMDVHAGRLQPRRQCRPRSRTDRRARPRARDPPTPRRPGRPPRRRAMDLSRARAILGGATVGRLV